MNLSLKQSYFEMKRVMGRAIFLLLIEFVVLLAIRVLPSSFLNSFYMLYILILVFGIFIIIISFAHVHVVLIGTNLFRRHRSMLPVQPKAILQLFMNRIILGCAFSAVYGLIAALGLLTLRFFASPSTDSLEPLIATRIEWPAVVIVLVQFILLLSLIYSAIFLIFASSLYEYKVKAKQSLAFFLVLSGLLGKIALNLGLGASTAIQMNVVENVRYVSVYLPGLLIMLFDLFLSGAFLFVAVRFMAQPDPIET